MVALTEELKREIGQHFVLGFLGSDITPEITELIRDYHVGHIIIMKRNVKDIPQLRALISSLQRIAKDAGHKQPLMIGIDQENGLVSAFSTSTQKGGTHFPGAMALASTGSLELAHDVSAQTAKEMRIAGLNWAYSPVADVNSDSRNPVIGVRSFGDDPNRVATFTTSVSQGLASQKIAPSVKHFPGHGDTHVDSHLGLPKISKTLEQLFATELVPFRKAIDSGVASIMTGHMALPLLTGDDTPASLSSLLSKELLRDRLGFEGVVVTDCLEMDAVLETYGTEKGAVLALQAGADVVMICHRIDRQVGALRETYQAVKNGQISLDELRLSGERVKVMKTQFAGTWDEVLIPEVDLAALSLVKKESLKLSRTAYDAAIALIRNPHSIVPFNPANSRRVLLFTPEMEVLNRAVDDAENIIRTKDGKTVRNTAGPSYTAFANALQALLNSSGSDTPPPPFEHIVYTPNTTHYPLSNTDIVIFATRNANTSTWQLDFLRDLVTPLFSSSTTLPKLAVIATCGPYDLLDPSTLGSIISYAYVASFEFTIQALEATAEVLFGKVAAKGQCPVSS